MQYKVGVKRYVGLRENELMVEWNMSDAGDTLGCPSDAKCYLSASQWFLAGAEALAQCSVKEMTSCIFLAAQSLECVLKGYLTHVSIDKKEVHKELINPTVRHNLELLWEKASDKGLGIPRNPSPWCLTLNSGHNRPFYMRYPMGGINITNPVIKTMMDELRNIVHEASEIIK